MRRDTRELTLFAQCEVTRGSWLPVNLDERAQREPLQPAPWCLAFQPPELRAKCLSFKVPVCDVLLRQPQLTETDPLDDHFRFVLTYLNGTFKWNHHGSFRALSALPALQAFQWGPSPHSPCWYLLGLPTASPSHLPVSCSCFPNP